MFHVYLKEISNKKDSSAECRSNYCSSENQMDYKSKVILVIKAEHRNGFVDKHFSVIEGADGVRKPVQFNTNPKTFMQKKLDEFLIGEGIVF